MNSKAKKNIVNRSFSKLGFTMTLLPYLFKEYDQWGDFMWNICYSARLSWYKCELAFLSSYLNCEFDFDEELTTLLSWQQIDSSPQLGEQYDLVLKPQRGNRKVRNFLALAKSYRFKELNSLVFRCMDTLDLVGTRYASKFLKFSLPKKINEVSLECDGEVEPYINSLCLLLPRVRAKITLSKFTFTGDELIKVLKSILRASEVIFDKCIFTEIDNNKMIKESPKFKVKLITVINLTNNQTTKEHKLQFKLPLQAKNSTPKVPSDSLLPQTSGCSDLTFLFTLPGPQIS
ncbi:unnamed protein product [Moneuplotes crassus]|uniref:Uncharacterized protein n=1 Tax=Euplotes crassus TaxID=5936 RepID=A0AAD1UGN4_EUPCR|nr:unnamed protein product [Moneuplotes crassus]